MVSAQESACFSRTASPHLQVGKLLAQNPPGGDAAAEAALSLGLLGQVVSPRRQVRQGAFKNGAKRTPNAKRGGGRKNAKLQAVRCALPCPLLLAGGDFGRFVAAHQVVDGQGGYRRCFSFTARFRSRRGR
jgi:hypothetical protein